MSFPATVGTAMVRLVPSDDVDGALHGFIPHAADYRAFCGKYADRFLERNPRRGGGRIPDHEDLPTPGRLRMVFEGPYGPPPGVLRPLNPGPVELVLDRRGSSVWKVRTGVGPYAVKVGYPSRTHTWTASAPAREAAVLRQLTHERILSGEWEHGTWSAQPWRHGDSLYDRWAPCRAKGTEPDLGEALSCAAILSALHGRGWAHGNVQPAHFLLGKPDGAFLIDLALAGGGRIPRAHDFPYQGCLVPYEAPEISAAVLDAGTATPTREADVYALGAALFTSVTGRRHVAYPDDASQKEQRWSIVAGPHRPVELPGVLGGLAPPACSAARPPTGPPAPRSARS